MIRIEKGVPTVAIGIYLQVLHTLQFDDDILWLAEEDKQGKNFAEFEGENELQKGIDECFENQRLQIRIQNIQVICILNFKTMLALEG